LDPLLPRYETEGKTYLTIGIGCTGGRHRSVYVAERLTARLREAGRHAEVAHRDLAPSGPVAPASPDIAS
jgi:RNase adapter protein RapZ